MIRLNGDCHARLEPYLPWKQYVFFNNSSLTDVHRRIKEVSPYITIGTKTFFIKTNKKMSEIEIDEAIFKTFQQNLIQLTSILKENNNAPA